MHRPTRRSHLLSCIMSKLPTSTQIRICHHNRMSSIILTCPFPLVALAQPHDMLPDSGNFPGIFLQHASTQKYRTTLLMLEHMLCHRACPDFMSRYTRGRLSTSWTKIPGNILLSARVDPHHPVTWPNARNTCATTLHGRVASKTA